MIEVKVWTDIATGDRHFEGIVHKKDLQDIELDKFDQMVVNSQEQSAADIFQSLEILARRQLEQTKVKEKVTIPVA